MYEEFVISLRGLGHCAGYETDIEQYFDGVDVIADPVEIEDAAVLINASKKPYLLAGQGVILSGSQNELLAFAEKGHIPVASTLLGLGGFPNDHPLYVGYLGMHGNYGPNKNTNECDLLIAVGMRFDDRVTGDVSRYAKQAKVIHVEIDKYFDWDHQP